MRFMRYAAIVLALILGGCSARNRLISALRDLPKLEKILASGVNPDTRAGELEPTALSVAVGANLTAAAKLLLQAGADPLLASVNPAPLNEVVCLGNREIFDFIMARQPKILSNQEILSGLVSTALVCHRRDMIALIPNGQKLEADITLLYACGSDPGKYDARAALLAGANPNQLDSVRRNPFYYPRCYRNIGLMRLALSKGLEIDNRDTANKTILMVAAETADLEAVKTLLRVGASWDDKVVVLKMQERTIRETVTSREINDVTNKSSEIKRPANRTIRHTLEIPLMDYAREHDPELYRLLMAKKPKRTQ